MEDAVALLDFETAAIIRDEILYLETMNTQGKRSKKS
jgi:protein-arginine kinase activator protein McsA